MLSWDYVNAAIRPLRFIFWGGILWIFDLTFSTTTGGTGFRCDLLDDTLATILIAVGVFRLARTPIPGKYATVMAFIKGVALASIAETALKHFIFPHPAPLEILLLVLGICQLTATLLFCLAMKWFCRTAGLLKVAASWNVTLLLFCAVYLLPLGLFYLAGLIVILAHGSFNIDLGPAGLLLLPVFAVPLIHLFISTSRLRRTAELGRVAPPAPGGFPVTFPPAEQPPPP